METQKNRVQLNRILVFTATYNEIENIENLLRSIREQLPQCDLLVVDDHSPDGTSDLIRKLQKTMPRLELIERSGKLGLGTAHRLAFQYAAEHGYDGLITMDADFSHHPKYLPTMVKNLEKSEFVIGSRYTRGGGCDYGLYRQVVSRTANLMARGLLGMQLKETTTAYRGYQKSLLARLDMSGVRSEGYGFFVESLYQIQKTTSQMTEFPIYFEDRRAGVSKVDVKELFRGVTTLLRLFKGRINKTTIKANS